MSLDISLFQDKCNACGAKLDHKTVLFETNTTHNLGVMAKEGRIYKLLWRPEELGVTQAKQIIEPLEKTIINMELDPQRYKKHDAPNGWGTYEQFLPWLKKLLDACKKYPSASLEVSR